MIPANRSHPMIFLLVVSLLFVLAGCQHAVPLPLAPLLRIATQTAQDGGAAAAPAALAEPGAISADSTESVAAGAPAPQASDSRSTDIALAQREIMEEAGFSYQAPQNYMATFRPGLVNLSNDEGSVFLLMIGLPRPEGVDLQAEIAGFAAYAADYVVENMQTGSAYPMSIQGLDGYAVDVTGALAGVSHSGKIVVLAPNDRQVLLAFGIGVDQDDARLWEEQGAAAFQTILEQVQFFEPVPMPDGCPLTADPTYGYAQENPIRVGGGPFGGPARERAYLDHLLGPDGQTVAYDRIASTEFNGAILDAFAVTYPGQTEQVTLYIDEYAFGPPKAPLGFRCAGPFPLPAP